MAKGSSSPTGEPAAPSALWHSLASSSASPARPSASRTATENAALDDRPAPTGMVLVTRRAPPEGGWAAATRAAARAACGGSGAIPPRGISHGSGYWSLATPIKKLPALGVKVASVARSMAMGSESPWL